MVTDFKQKGLRLGTQSGSFINSMMSSNKTVPEVGKGATTLHWSDRSTYEVMEVSNDKKHVIVRQYQPERIDNYGMSDSQQYKYEKLIDCDEVIVWKWNSWRWQRNHIEFIEGNMPKVGSAEYEDCFDKETGLLMLLPGITREVKTYPKVNILWGVLDEYYDYTF